MKPPSKRYLINRAREVWKKHNYNLEEYTDVRTENGVMKKLVRQRSKCICDACHLAQSVLAFLGSKVVK